MIRTTLAAHDLVFSMLLQIARDPISGAPASVPGNLAPGVLPSGR